MRRAPLFLSALAFAAASSLAPLGAQDPEAEKPGRPSKPLHAEVIALKHAVAHEMATVLSASLHGSVLARVRLVPDPRTNAILVSAEEGDLDHIRRLVGALDVEPRREKPAGPAPRRSVTYEIVLFMMTADAAVSAKLPRTTAGVIDASNPDAVLAKLREGIGQPGLTEVAKLSVMADDGRPWKWRQSVQVPVMSAARGNPTFGGYQDATVELSVNSESGRGVDRRLGISGRVERFAEVEPKPDDPGPVPPPKHMSNIEFSATVEDGKLVMSAVESAATRFDAGYVLFVRVKP
jgi:hypothetical protein